MNQNFINSTYISASTCTCAHLCDQKETELFNNLYCHALNRRAALAGETLSALETQIAPTAVQMKKKRTMQFGYENVKLKPKSKSQ